MNKKTRGAMSLQKNGKSHYQNHRDYYIKRSKIQKEEKRQWYFEFKKSLSCKDCGASDFRFMEFDHINDNKLFNISQMIRLGFSKNNILKEIEKCDPVCANCHNIRTWERNHTPVAQ